MKKPNFYAQNILKKKFATELSGYNPLEVDQYLDQIIEDYWHFDQQIKTLEKTLSEKEKIISQKSDQIAKLEMEVENLKNQIFEAPN